MWAPSLVLGPVTATALCLLLVVLGIWAWQRWRFLRGLRDAGVPGPSPHFFSGNLMEFRYGEKPPHLVVHDWLKRYGNIVGFHMGLHRYLVVKDLDLLQDIFIKDFKNFSTRPPPSISTDDFRDSVLQTEQTRWKPMRSLLISCFTASKMKQMSPLVSRSINSTLELIDEASERGEDVDVHGLFQALTLDVIASCALALKTNCQRDADDPFLSRVRFFMDNASNPITQVAFAFPLIADAFGVMLKLFSLSEKMIMMINDNLTEVVRRRRENPKQCPQDILQAMLDASEEQDGNGDNSKIRMTDQEVKSNALVMLLAGYETTANALVFTAYLLAKHPDVQERVYDEMVEHLPADDEALRYDDLSNLPYLDQVLSESLRFYPPVVSFVSRHAAQTTKIGPYTIPAGVNVMAPVWTVHHDPNVWPDPERFDPERFSRENSEGRHPMAFLSFGAGPRYCFGRRFAMLETKMLLVRLLRRFRMEMSESTPAELEIIVPTVTLNAKGEVRLRMTPR